MRTLVILVFTFFLLWQCAVGQVGFEANGPLEFCDSGSVTLCIQPEYESYLWNNGSSTRCITVTQSGEYYAHVLDSFGNIDLSMEQFPAIVTVYDPLPTITKHYDTLWVTESFDSYQWYLDDQPIADATEQYHVAAIHEGVWIYKVHVWDSIGCTASSWWIDFPPVPNALDNMEYEWFQLYPNLATTHITLSTERGGIERITLFDITGKEVSFPPLLSATEKAITLDVSGLPAGIYFGRAGIGESIRSFKWVKQ